MLESKSSIGEGQNEWVLAQQP